jgi:hypothetical protein
MGREEPADTCVTLRRTYFEVEEGPILGEPVHSRLAVRGTCFVVIAASIEGRTPTVDNAVSMVCA